MNKKELSIRKKIIRNIARTHFDEYVECVKGLGFTIQNDMKKISISHSQYESGKWENEIWHIAQKLYDIENSAKEARRAFHNLCNAVDFSSRAINGYIAEKEQIPVN